MNNYYQLYYRLIALWVICESVLGGIIHGLKLPISGLIVGSCAIGCICLIGRYVPQRGAILKATLIVAIFKMLLSPQSPLPAYFAVFFQGILGELLFFSRRFYPISCLFLGVLGLVESGVQRILVMTLLYGKNFWEAVNVFIHSFVGTASQTPTNYALYLAGGYILLHALLGLVVGILAAKLPQQLNYWREKYPLGQLSMPINTQNSDKISVLATKKSSKSYWKNIFGIVWVVLLLLYIQSYWQVGGKALLPQSLVAGMLLRSVFLLLSWYFLVSPLLTLWLKKWLQKKQEHEKTTLEEVLRLLPETRALLALAWQQTVALKGLKRIWIFLKIVICYAVADLYTKP